MTNPAPDLKSIERTFAYEMASSLIDSECIPVDMAEPGSEVEAVWFDLGDLDGEVDLHDAVTYLDSRRLLYRHPTHPNLVQVCDETEPLPAPESNEISLVPAGLQTPEGSARVQKAMDDHTDAIVVLANFATGFDDKHGYEFDRIATRDQDFSDELDELREHIERRRSAQDEMLRAIAGHPKAGA